MTANIGETPLYCRGLSDEQIACLQVYGDKRAGSCIG